MILTKTVKIKWNYRNKSYYIQKGYLFTNVGDFFDVSVEDLIKSSKETVEIQCDYCGKIYNVCFSDYINSMLSPVKKNSCCQCKKLKEIEIYDVLTYELCLELNENATNDIHVLDALFLNKKIIPLFDFYKTEKSYIPFKCEKHDNIFFATIQRIKQKKTNCSRCRSERAHQIKRFSDDFVLSTIANKGYFVKDDFYYNSFNGYMTVYCIKHPETPISVMYSNFINQKSCCKKCISENRLGEGGSNWRGGRTSEKSKIRASEKYISWRNSVFERDTYKCRCCGYSEGIFLEAHHILNFSEREDLRFDVENGITLCKKCHNVNQVGSFHNIYGTTENTKEQLEEYLLNNYGMLPRIYTIDEKRKIRNVKEDKRVGRNETKWIKFNCDFCGKENERLKSEYKEGTKHFCNVYCKGSYKSKKSESDVIVKCSNCGKETNKKYYNIKRYKNSFCSEECQCDFFAKYPSVKRKEFIKFNCELCGKETEQDPSDYKHSNHHFCSKSCSCKYAWTIKKEAGQFAILF